MIHIATIHFASSLDRPPARTCARNATEPYRVYAYLNGIDRAHFAKFAYAIDRERRIIDKLDDLAEVISAQAGPDDLLVFMHGDAFPIAPWVEPVRAMVAEHRLAGVRRDENCAEPMPHPCFTATTPAFWREIDGDWSEGPCWMQPDRREVTDAGAVLWRKLSELGVDWQLDAAQRHPRAAPVWFGVYGA